jgi:hypothetical protein
MTPKLKILKWLNKIKRFLALLDLLILIRNLPKLIFHTLIFLLILNLSPKMEKFIGSILRNILWMKLTISHSILNL